MVGEPKIATLRVSASKAGVVDLIALNGMPVKTCTGLTLRLERNHVAQLTLEVDVWDGMELDLPCEVSIVGKRFPPRARLWRRLVGR